MTGYFIDLTIIITSFDFISKKCSTFAAEIKKLMFIMKTTKEMIEVMQAYERGKQIEFIDSSRKWKDTTNPIWDWARYDYRVKPKKYVPFETADEFFAAQRKHGRDIIACGELYANSYIDCYCNVFLYKGSETNIFTFNFETLLENCTFADGIPCGKEVAK